jgi:hypothetical protein
MCRALDRSGVRHIIFTHHPALNLPDIGEGLPGVMHCFRINPSSPPTVSTFQAN